MKLQLLRFGSLDDSTLSVLLEIKENLVSIEKKKLLCFVLEDEYRTIKKYGETRIPKGSYKIKLRTHGGFHQRYSERFPWHEGMFEISDVPGFTDILIHIGNTHEDTEGCLLVADSLDISKRFAGASAVAYEKIYKYLLPHVKKGEVELDIVDYDFM